MEIVQATKEDNLDFLILVRNFLRETKYPFRLDKAKLSESFEQMLEHPDFTVIMAKKDGEPVGLLVGGASEPLFSSDKVATELAWYIEPEFRDGRTSMKMFKQYEDWAKEVNCKFVTMVDIDSLQNLDTLYSRKGYTLTEKTYVKEL